MNLSLVPKHTHLKGTFKNIIFNCFPTESFKSIEPIILMLQQTDPSKLLAPNYKLVVRGADSIISEVNQTAPSFDCHYTGQIEGLEFSKVAFSICDNKLVSLVFILKTTGLCF